MGFEVDELLHELVLGGLQEVAPLAAGGAGGPVNGWKIKIANKLCVGPCRVHNVYQTGNVIRVRWAIDQDDGGCHSV